MDMKLAEQRRNLGVLIDQLNTDALIADAALYAAKEREITDCESTIKRTEAAQQRSAALARPVGSAPALVESEIEYTPPARTFGMHGAPLNSGLVSGSADAQFSRYLSRARSTLGFTVDGERHFRSFGEQLQAIAQYANSRGAKEDSRLIRAPSELPGALSRAPTGAGEVDPTGGGFSVQTDFASAIWMLAHDMGELLSRVNKIPISASANGIKIPGIDETSRLTGSRWGGVQSYWVDEGTAPTPTKPKFRMIEFNLHKLISTMYMTDELLQDSTALTAIAGQAFSEEIMFMTEDGIFEGSGAGLPLGFINAPALISVAKQAGQTTGTIVKENIDNMWARCLPRMRKNAVWLINQDCEPQLNQLNQAVGTGGQLVYLPPGGLSGAPYASLYGRPLVATEYSSALGTPGDIALVDLSTYTLVDKGGVQAATSMHVAFLTDQMVFRITYRVDGKPMLTSAITPFKGTLTKSAFVALATR
jgi:HK97 family phage major capsid protein